MTIADNLIAARALIDTPEKWHQGSLRDGCRLCAMGAIGEVVQAPWTSSTPEFAALRSAIPDTSDSRSVPYYNDLGTTTHADVMAWFDRAITAALETPANPIEEVVDDQR